MSRELFLDHALQVAPQLLGAMLTVAGADGEVALRITEVEAYHGVGTPLPYDGGSHSRSRKTERNASMFGPPGHAYVYLSHGIHFALNLVCSPEGIASGVLIRAGEIVSGEAVARARREEKRRAASHGAGAPPIPDRLLARGPGNLATALGITRPVHNGLDLFTEPFGFEPAARPLPPARVASGPRVGVAGEYGGSAFPWRFWVADDPTVSAYRPGRNVPRD
ncbi:MAG: DNA-3-methyladenine glycosylase [Leucobacter sp.]|nr:DNA-3-methyladenine glycosylase [Leucobacter sp.]